MAKKSGNVKAGEAGHKGFDRQPDTIAPAEVKERSTEAKAGMKNQDHQHSDMIHPGPDREEGERSKGDAHHNQREREKEMKPKGL